MGQANIKFKIEEDSKWVSGWGQGRWTMQTPQQQQHSGQKAVANQISTSRCQVSLPASNDKQTWAVYLRNMKQPINWKSRDTESEEWWLEVKAQANRKREICTKTRTSNADAGAQTNQQRHNRTCRTPTSANKNRQRHRHCQVQQHIPRTTKEMLDLQMLNYVRESHVHEGTYLYRSLVLKF